MSLAILRDGPLSSRRNDRAATLRKRSSRLRALNAVTAALTQHIGLPNSLQTDFLSDPPPSLTNEEVQILSNNDLEKGRYFQESTLPISRQSFDNYFVSGKSATNTSDQGAIAPGHAPITTTSGTRAVASTDTGSRGLLDATGAPHPANLESNQVVGSVTLATPRTLHPTRDDTTQAQENNQQRNEVVNHATEIQKDNGIGLGLQVELASSPSSTAGAWSAATPMPGDPSPVTSVDDEAALERHKESPSKDEELQQQEHLRQKEHDTLLQAQKEIARREARGDDIASPGVQLRFEQEQAVRATRDATSAAQPPVASPVVLPPATHAPIGAISLEADAPQTPMAAPPPKIQDARISLDTTPKAAQVLPTKAEATPVSALEQPSQATPIEGPQRMRTRVSSGVLRHKSVSEIIQDSPKNAPFTSPRQTHDATPSRSNLSIVKPRDNVPAAVADVPRSSHALPSTQVAADLDASILLPALPGGYAALKGAAQDPNRDYLEPLYRIQAQDPPYGRSLAELLHKSSKSVNTSDQLACMRERQDFRLLKRIYHMQNTNNWSLRQPEPCPEPPVIKTHMDHLLAEMKWMRTDFRQERKMKKSLAKFMAKQCSEWVNADADGRLDMQVKTAKGKDSTRQDGMPHSPAVTTGDGGELHSQSDSIPPELESSGNDLNDSPIDDMPQTPQYAIAPSSLYVAANISGETYHLRESEEFVKAIHELPLYAPFDEPDQSAEPTFQPQPRSVPAVSKFYNGRILTKIPAPMKKRSRYSFEDEDDELDVAETGSKRPRVSEEGSGLEPEQTDIALFDPENKPIRDRLHANTAFRPPSEYPMPSIQFYEFRLGSQWTWEDDQRLRRLAKDYCFNWSLISDEMALPSSLHTAAERRTPWECFERWVELESLPNEMRKTVYFKTWGQRMETASRSVDARYQAQLQAHSQNLNATQQPVRRRTNPWRVEKRRQGRYLHVVDAMRKLARKREQQAHKQAEAQKAASLRKQHENVQPKSNMHTPQEFSKMRHERDLQMIARQERYREQMAAQQKAAQMQRTGQYAGSQQAASANPQQRPGSSSAALPQNPQAHVGGHAQQGSNVQVLPNGAPNGAPTRNGHLAPPGMAMQGNNVPQAQMQAQQRSAQSTAEMQRLAMQAQFKNPQMTNQQYQMSNQARVSPGGGQGPTGHMSSQIASNQAMIAAMQAASNSGVSSNNVGASMQQSLGNHTNSTNTSASPHMPPPPTPMSQPQQLSSGHVPAINQIKHSLQAQHPQATAAQIDAMANDHMKQRVQQAQAQAQARQNAINAASGSHGGIQNNTAYSQNATSFQQNNNNGSNYNTQQSQQQQQPNANGVPFNGSTSPQQQQYSQMMRQRLMQQQQSLHPSNGSIVTGNGSPRLQAQQPVQASPNAMHVSPNMAHAVPSVSVNGQQQRQASRSATPQMVRVSSSGGMTSPGMAVPGPGGQVQGSPRTGMVRQ